MAASAKFLGSCLAFLRIYAVVTLISCVNCQYYFTYQSPDDCARAPTDQYHEMYDISQLRCLPCTQTTEFQTVSADGFWCVCQPGTKLTQDYGGATIECAHCPDEQVTSVDGWSCVACDADSPYNPVLKQCQACIETEITVERSLDGSWPVDPPEQQCQSCSVNTAPSVDGSRCERCNQVLSVLPSASDCLCPADQLAGGVCFSEPADLIDDNSQLFNVKFTEDLEVDSAFFYENIRAAQGMCEVDYSNITACQVLGNMCVLILYTRYYENSAQIQDACAGYLALTENLRGATDEWPASMPWLYYLEDPADQVLADTRITTEFTFPDSTLNFKAAQYSLYGEFEGIKDVTGGLLQLCKASESIMDAAWNFGTTYEQSCQLSSVDLYDPKLHSTNFFDLYLQYESSGGESQLYAVPVLITNYEDDNGLFPNKGSDQTTWQLVRRFFLVDNISGRVASSDPDAPVIPRAVRYVKEMILHIQLQDSTKDGKIYPPYLEITYGVITEEDYNVDKQVTVDFRVSYSMNLERYNEDVSITLGVLCALAVLFAGVQTWGWSKRAGKIAIDFVTLIKFAIFTVGDLANVFFIVALGSSLWWLIFYKRQTNVYLMLPNSSQDDRFVSYIAAAFALKLIQLIHMIICQVTVDIFLIDWERPRGKISSSNDAGQKSHDATVSIWRTYFVANEWNEIQTIRKINATFQIFAALFFLEVIGFGFLASSDPQDDFSRNSDNYYAPDSRIFRFALLGIVYVAIAVVQYVFFTFIYERFIEDKVRQYVDLCSMSNVSVFIMENSQFGYYIHGRSVHGRADTDMREMSENLKREEEDLCGQRGLLPNTEQQTFQIAVPQRFRQQYDKVMLPIYTQQGAQVRSPTPGGGGGAGHLDPQTEKIIDGYKVLNRFLQAFIDHSLRDVDYIIKDKMLLESILDVEFMDASTKGFFYNDDGHSFDAVLFFGNEMTLLIFEVLLFSVIDLMSGSYILSGILTYVFMQIISSVRDSLGGSNLAKKTLVDKRFLI